MIKKITTVFCLLFCLQVIVATVHELEYTSQLTISDGLAHNGATSLIADSKGYVWIGTYDGLNRYDGYSIETYKNTIYNELLVSNRVRSLAEDKKGNIWVGTDEGIALFDYSIEKFRVIYSKPRVNNEKRGPIVRKILVIEGAESIFCLTEGEGVLVFDEDYNLKKQLLPGADYDVSQIEFLDGVEVDSQNYMFVTNIGLISYNLASETFKTVVPSGRNSGPSSIVIRGKNIVATLNTGIVLLRVRKDANHISYRIKDVIYENTQFSSISIDASGNLWLGTVFEGLIKINNFKSLISGKPYKEEFFARKNRFLRTSSIIANTKYGCWVTSFNRGVYRFDINENPFKKYILNENETSVLRSNSISHISGWDKDRIFLSALKGGFAMFNTKSNEFEPLPFNIPDDIPGIASVYVDSHKDIWLKLLGNRGMGVVRKGSRSIEFLDQEKFPVLRNIRTRTITEDHFGNLWLGDEAGVYKITLDQNRKVRKVESLNDHPLFQKYPLDMVRYIYSDPLYEFLWIGTDSDGLVRVTNEVDIDITRFKINRYLRDKTNPNSISSNFVSTIVRMPNNELWIGTERGGVCKVLNDNADPDFVVFTERNGLSNNVVKRIFYDEDYNLWVATNKGLNKLFTKDNHFRTFTKIDGLPFEDFWYACVKLANGYVVLSGMEGICFFKPDEVQDKERLPKMEFTNLRIFNKLVKPFDTIDNRVLIDKRLNDLEYLELEYDENVFSIDINSLHYSSPDNHFIKYQMLPLNQEWIQVPSGQKVISFSGINPGEYTLRAMVSNSIGEWTAPKEIAVKIKPPYWKSTQAYLFYVIFTGLVIYIIIYFVLQLQSLKHNLQIEHLEKEKGKAVNAAKLRYFSNISHEIKTPLTLISGPINILSERFRANTDVSEKLEIVQRQSRKISQLIDQVHDFQRSDANILQMDITRFCFDNLIAELTSDFEFLAKTDNKQLDVKTNSNKIFVSADADKLGKIINNLLNNAFKYTYEKALIQVAYEKIGNELIIRVKDTGKGIEEDDLPHIFERFYQSKHKHSAYTGGSGIGLAFTKRLVDMHYGNISAESKVGEGSTFIVSLPIVIDATEELVDKARNEFLEMEKRAVEPDVKEEKIDIHKIKVNESFSDTSIFFVEDNTEMRQFVKGVLSRFFKVRSFKNGLECFEALKEEWPDIVVSDVLMPEMNGFDLCQKIKSDVKTSHIPLILLTACTTIDEQVKGFELGADAYIKKPFNIQHLITRIETLMSNRKALRERYSIDIPLTKQAEDQKGNEDAFLEKLYELMEKNLDNQALELDSFAKELYLNRTHFFQKVKAITNQTPYEILKSYRVKKAAEFLVQQKLSVNEVFIMTGFKSRAHFSKLFKEKYNTTPGKYAAEMLKKYDDTAS